MSSYIFQNKNILANNSKMDLFFLSYPVFPKNASLFKTVAKFIDSGIILRATAYVPISIAIH